jgi:hypothetical protein
MAKTPKISASHDGEFGSFIFCQHGVIYTVAPHALGALLDESASIVRQLRRIQGVTVKLIDGVMNALFPPILLAEVARVMQPLPPTGPAPAAYRGRIR